MRLTQQRFLLLAVTLTAAALSGVGCARPDRTAAHVAAISPAPPPDLGPGKRPWGGPSESPTGAGAGGSAAAGYEAGRVGGPYPIPTVPKYPYGVSESRMSPVASDGSAAADRGHPIPPDQPLVPANAVGVTQPLSPAPTQIPINVKVD